MHSVPLPTMFPIVAARIRDMVIMLIYRQGRILSSRVVRADTTEQRAEPRSTEDDSVKGVQHAIGSSCRMLSTPLQSVQTFLNR